MPPFLNLEQDIRRRPHVALNLEADLVSFSDRDLLRGCCAGNVREAGIFREPVYVRDPERHVQS